METTGIHPIAILLNRDHTKVEAVFSDAESRKWVSEGLIEDRAPVATAPSFVSAASSSSASSSAPAAASVVPSLPVVPSAAAESALGSWND
jgi:hypothetical protein